MLLNNDLSTLSFVVDILNDNIRIFCIMHLLTVKCYFGLDLLNVHSFAMSSCILRSSYRVEPAMWRSASDSVE